MADFGVRITINDLSPYPTYGTAPWASGVLQMTSGAYLEDWTQGMLLDVGPLGEYADIAAGGNYAAISNFAISVAAMYENSKWLETLVASGATLYGATVEIVEIPSLTKRFSGVVVGAAISGVEVTLTCEPMMSRIHREIPARKITSEDFPGLSPDAVGAPVPIIFGPAQSVPLRSVLSEPEYMDVLGIPAGGSRTYTPCTPGFAWPTPDDSTHVSAQLGGGFSFLPDWISDIVGGDYYLEIASGPGAGQTRLITSYNIWSGNLYIQYVLASAFDVLPTTASALRVFRRDVPVELVACDEGEIERLTDSGGEAQIPFVQTEIVPGIIVADASGEFRSGEDLQSIYLVRPGFDDGHPCIKDRLSESGEDAIQIHTSTLGGDGWCFFKISADQYPVSMLPEKGAINVLLSIDSPTFASTDDKTYLVVGAIPWEGGFDRIHAANAYYGKQKLVSSGGDGRVNAFSPQFATDGTPGNFPRFAVEIDDLPRPLCAYKELRFCVCTYSDRTAYRMTDVANWVYGTVRQTFRNDDSARVISVGDRLQIDDRGYWMGTNTIYTIWVPGGEPDAFVDFSLSKYDGWRTIQAIVSKTLYSGPIYTYVVDLDSSPPFPSREAPANVVPLGAFSAAKLYEAAVAFAKGSISPDSQFLADFASGRTLDSSPVVTLPQAAQSIISTDLGRPDLVDSASFDALPETPITAALVDVENSADILARMAREGNWILSHDASGRVRAVAWLDLLWGYGADFAVSTGDIVAGSISTSETSLEDLVLSPTVQWGWTAANGFSQSATVSDVVVETVDLDESNYQTAISGFGGGYPGNIAVHGVLHDAWRYTMVRGEAQVEYRYGGDPDALFLGRRLRWGAYRKKILDFHVPENHLVAAAIVGDRIAVEHRRHTSGVFAYGTIAGKWWHPTKGTIQLVVMLDPPSDAEPAEIYQDTLDASAVTPDIQDYLDPTAATPTLQDILEGA